MGGGGVQKFSLFLVIFYRGEREGVQFQYSKWATMNSPGKCFAVGSMLAPGDGVIFQGGGGVQTPFLPLDPHVSFSICNIFNLTLR